jgi:hypothetical protein
VAEEDEEEDWEYAAVGGGSGHVFRKRGSERGSEQACFQMVEMVEILI